MNLKTYISQSRGNARRLSQKLGISQVMVSMWNTGSRAVPAERCPAIEQATGGLVRCEDLRPDVAWSVLRQAPNSGAPAAQAAGQGV